MDSGRMTCSTASVTGSLGQRANSDRAELDLGALGLEPDPALIHRGVKALVHEIAVQPHLDGSATGFDDQLVPLSYRFLGAIGEVHDPARVALGAAPLLARPARPSRFHVLRLDVFPNDPEVAGVSAHQLHFDGLREHLVESARGGRMDQHTAVAGRSGEAIFDLEPVIAVAAVGEEVALGFAQAHQLAIANQEAGGTLRVGVTLWNIRLPARQVLAVEEADSYSRRCRIACGRR